MFVEHKLCFDISILSNGFMNLGWKEFTHYVHDNYSYIVDFYMLLYCMGNVKLYFIKSNIEYVTCYIIVIKAFTIWYIKTYHFLFYFLWIIYLPAYFWIKPLFVLASFIKVHLLREKTLAAFLSLFSFILRGFVNLRTQWKRCDGLIPQSWQNNHNKLTILDWFFLLRLYTFGYYLQLTSLKKKNLPNSFFFCR